MLSKQHLRGASAVALLVTLLPISLLLWSTHPTAAVAIPSLGPGQSAASTEPAMTALREAFNNAHAPRDAQLNGTWVLIRHIMTRKFQMGGREGGERVLFDAAGVRRESSGGRLEWVLTFSADGHGHLQASSDVVGGAVGGTVVRTRRNTAGDVAFDQDYGGDGDYTYQCRITAADHLVCLLSQFPAGHGVEFIRMPPRQMPRK